LLEMPAAAPEPGVQLLADSPAKFHAPINARGTDSVHSRHEIVSRLDAARSVTNQDKCSCDDEDQAREDLRPLAQALAHLAPDFKADDGQHQARDPHVAR